MAHWSVVDNIISVDFRAPVHSEPTTLELMACDVFGMLPLPDFFNALYDTSPSEYSAPPEDCA
jgi:hypothetical protein